MSFIQLTIYCVNLYPSSILMEFIQLTISCVNMFPSSTLMSFIQMIISCSNLFLSFTLMPLPFSKSIIPSNHLNFPFLPISLLTQIMRPYNTSLTTGTGVAYVILRKCSHKEKFTDLQSLLLPSQKIWKRIA